MRKKSLILPLILFFSSLAYGYTQSPPLEVVRTSKANNANVTTVTKREASYQSRPTFQMDKLSSLPHSPSRRARFTLYPGSLKYNITQLGKQFGWRRVVWQPDYDFQWVGKTRVAASSLRAILTKVLKDYPLQAIFYQGNHVLVIAPRNIK